MAIRRLTCTMLCLAIAMLSVLCSNATAGAAREAKALHLVAFHSCNAVLPAVVFSDELEEVSPPQFSHAAGTTAEVTICKYAGLEKSGIGGLESFTNGGLGVECLGNVIKLTGNGETPPPGGCYRIDNSSILFARGPAVEKLLRHHHRSFRSRFWPAGFTRVVLPGVGSRAEFGYSATGQGYGYLQVVNATLTVETAGGTSIIQVLRGAASRL